MAVSIVPILRTQIRACVLNNIPYRYKMKIILAGVVLALSGAVCAQTIEQPAVKSGDTWLYRLTTERAPNGWLQTHSEFLVERVTPSAIYFNVKQQGSSQPPNAVFMGRDWSMVRNVNGKETIVNQPLAFPLTVGKTWEIDFEEQQPNRQFKSQTWNRKFTVVGYEMAEVPAGKFRALKVESEGRWVAELAPSQNVVQGAQTDANGASLVSQVRNVPAGTKATGRSYAALWYAPEIKRWVKSVEDEYDSGGARNARHISELESFKVAE
jgi:hypothetical protein